MRLPLSWLRDLVPVTAEPADRASVAALASDLDALGLVVEGIERVGEGLESVVLARVLEISAIEGLDRVRRVLVDAGGPDPVEIACGAWNFEVGDVVPLAPIGSELPGGFKIGKRKMRGFVSNGMLCSGSELGLSDDGAGLLVLGNPGVGRAGAGSAAVAPPAPGSELVPGTPIVDYLGVEPDVVFDLAIEGNRPDCLSVLGVARDVAARLGLPLLTPAPVVVDGGPEATSLATIEILAPELCSRFIARVLTGVQVVPSPARIARRLTLAGMRPIDAIVDASNYVMLELGQPSHPYDLDKIPGGGLRVRAAHEGESLVTLDGVTRLLGTRPPRLDDPLASADCLICDAEDRPVGIAGVMGGASTEIGPATTTVLLEAAGFLPLAVAQTARWLGLRTEASLRFEKGTDPDGIERAASRYCELVAEACAAAGVPAPTIASGIVDARGRAAPRRRIVVRPARVNALLGTALTPGEVATLIEPLGFAVEPAVGDAGEGLEVVAPSFRPDVHREVDVIEEVARRVGYQELPTTERRSPFVGRLSEVQVLRRRLRRILAGLGAHEAWTTSIVDPGEQARGGLDGSLVRLTNPMVAEESALRGGLLPGLLGVARHNASHRRPWLRLFEVGDVFGPPVTAEDELPDEREQVGLLLAAQGDDAAEAMRAWRTIADALRLDEVTVRPSSAAGLHPARAAAVEAGGVVLGHLGEVDPDVTAAFALPHQRVGWLELDLVRLAAAPRRSPVARPVSRFPSSDVDLAFVVADEVVAGDVEATLAEAAGELCESIELFDVYRGAGVPEGSRSLAYRVRFCALDRTLTDAEVAERRAACIAAVEAAHGASLRS